MNKLLAASLAAAVAFWPMVPALAQTPVGYQDTQSNRVVTVPVTTLHPLPVTSTGDTDTRTAAANITAADAATTSAAGQNNVGQITGTPTANSAVTWAINGQSAFAITTTGTFSLTGQIEASGDGGTTYVVLGCRQAGAAITSSAVTGKGTFFCDVPGITNIRLRATAYTSGTLSAYGTASPASGLTRVIGSITPYAVGSSLTSGLTTAMTGTTSTLLIAAPATGLRNYITALSCGNSHATVGTFVELQDGSGGTTFFTVPAAAVYGGAIPSFPAPLRQPTTATGLYVKDTTTGANVVCSASGFAAP